ncbi:hypothetical protein GLAREA_12793 [Glarea lozoyensis ATCC 20868]|uniref:Uncharacterized protein n=1 Tax=Glarea lozoyensis (strain ATCC 20868 / MF5171) TaxID=1116229 RepID=S3CWN3_GLAL2|nr:uncharacterized protein GLAREA_12793 [Glarea lozoyensis ATCC 20868]EPE30070.1 hypothetical protein GLAREA_12793 [Glarea lozoyensis ATCC 20868]
MWLLRKKETPEMDAASKTTESLEESWSDVGEESSKESDTLPSIIGKFVQVITTSPKYMANNSHSHTSLKNISNVATALQYAIKPNTPPSKRHTTLRDLALGLQLWPTDSNIQLQQDAARSIPLLHKYMRDTLKSELAFIEDLHAKERLKQTRLTTQIGGYHGAGEEPADDSLRKLATLRYQADNVLIKLEKIITM